MLQQLRFTVCKIVRSRWGRESIKVIIINLMLCMDSYSLKLCFDEGKKLKLQWSGTSLIRAAWSEGVSITGKLPITLT